LGTYFEETLLITLTFVLNARAKGNNAAIPEKKKSFEKLKTWAEICIYQDQNQSLGQ